MNSNLIRFALKELETAGAGSTIVTIGKKGRDALARGGYEIAAAFPGFGDKPTFGDVTPLVRLLVDDFLAGRSAGVTLVHPTFVSTLTQRPEGVQLLPIRATADTAGIPGNQFLFEPNPGVVLEALLPRYVASRVYQAVLDPRDLDVERLLQEASRLLASFAQQMGLALAASLDEERLASLELERIGERRVLMVLGLDRQRARTLVLELETPLGREALAAVADVLACELCGGTLAEARRLGMKLAICSDVVWVTAAEVLVRLFASPS